METKTNGNDLAFARASFYNPDGGFDNTPQSGLTKREYFAAMAMQGLISNAPNGNLHNTKEGASLATEWADALIEQLNKNNNEKD